jgi:hypothetical protein
MNKVSTLSPPRGHGRIDRAGRVGPPCIAAMHEPAINRAGSRTSAATTLASH